MFKNINYYILFLIEFLIDQFIARFKDFDFFRKDLIFFLNSFIVQIKK